MTTDQAREAKAREATCNDELQVRAREAIAQALYEHWVAEDFGNEYCGWQQLPDKTTWLSRADAALAAPFAAHQRAEVIEECAKVADERAASRTALFDENGASINAAKAVEAEEIAAALRKLKEPTDGWGSDHMRLLPSGYDQACRLHLGAVRRGAPAHPSPCRRG